MEKVFRGLDLVVALGLFGFGFFAFLQFADKEPDVQTIILIVLMLYAGVRLIKK